MDFITCLLFDEALWTDAVLFFLVVAGSSAARTILGFLYNFYLCRICLTFSFSLDYFSEINENTLSLSFPSLPLSPHKIFLAYCC